MIIDTGFETMPIPDWFRDMHPRDASREKLLHDYAYHLIGAMNNPVKFSTVRDHVLANWRFLYELAAAHPEVFDEFLSAYVERWQA